MDWPWWLCTPALLPATLAGPPHIFFVHRLHRNDSVSPTFYGGVEMEWIAWWILAGLFIAPFVAVFAHE